MHRPDSAAAVDDPAADDPAVNDPPARIDEYRAELERRRDRLVAELRLPRPAANPRIDAAGHAVNRLLNEFRGELPGFACAPSLSFQTRGQFEALRRADNEWSPAYDLLKTQRTGRRRRLLPREPAPDSLRGRQSLATDALVAALQDRLTAAQAPAAADHGCFADIPLPHSEFVSLAHAARRAALARTRGGPISFLDVGCGCGMKLLAAIPFFDRIVGLEFDPGYVAAGRRLLAGGVRRQRLIPYATETGDVELVQGDALEYPDYRRFDVVYFYQPMRDEERLQTLEQRIVAGVRPGTLLIAPYRGFGGRFQTFGCARVAGRLYLAGADAAAARRLRRRAERLGTALRRTAPQWPGFWEPLLVELARRGFVRT